MMIMRGVVRSVGDMYGGVPLYRVDREIER